MILGGFLLIFIILSLTIGGNETAKSVVTLMLNGAVLAINVFAVYLGLNPIFSTAIACALMGIISLFFQNGYNKKTLVAFISVASVVFVLVIFAYWIIVNWNLQGFPLGQVSIRESNGYNGEIGISMVLVQVATLLIILEGALIDTSVSVVSAMEEVRGHREGDILKSEEKSDNSFSGISIRELYDSGLNVGRNILSSTVNTLFFIFIGQNFVFFAYYKNDYTLESVLNSKALIQPTLGIIICAIGCIAVIPVTAFLGSRMLKNK